jgi:hypothetical protein
MKKSILILACIALIAGLGWTASAICSTCGAEADWSESATSFIEGKPINDTAPLWGPKAVRQTESQFSKSAATEASAEASGNASAASAVSLELESIAANPSSVSKGNFTMINAAFKVSGNESASDNLLLTASAVVKNSLGSEVGRFNLVRSSGNEYSGSWKADAEPGLYNVTLAASSLQASETFNDVLQIEVLGAGNETESPARAATNLG